MIFFLNFLQLHPSIIKLTFLGLHFSPDRKIFNIQILNFSLQNISWICHGLGIYFKELVLISPMIGIVTVLLDLLIFVSGKPFELFDFNHQFFYFFFQLLILWDLAVNFFH